MNYYEENPEDIILQGDIFKSHYIFSCIDELFLIRDHAFGKENTESEAKIILADRVDDRFQSGGEYIVNEAKEVDIIVLSQTCDIQQRGSILISPVYPLASITSLDHIKRLRNNQVNYRFYLPEKEGLIEESYAELTIMNPIKKESLSIDGRVLSLSEAYRPHLTEHIHRFFCRPFLSDD